MSSVLVPTDAWEDNQEAVVVNWIFQDGAHVTQGEVLCEIMYEKVQVDIIANATGTLHIEKEVDELVQRGDQLGRIIE